MSIASSNCSARAGLNKVDADSKRQNQSNTKNVWLMRCFFSLPQIIAFLQSKQIPLLIILTSKRLKAKIINTNTYFSLAVWDSFPRLTSVPVKKHLEKMLRRSQRLIFESLENFTKKTWLFFSKLAGSRWSNSWIWSVLYLSKGIGVSEIS